MVVGLKLVVLAKLVASGFRISRFDMSCAQVHWVGSKPIRTDGTVMQLKLHKPTMVIGYSLRMCAQKCRFDQSRSK